jgi:hypothetical protein
MIPQEAQEFLNRVKADCKKHKFKLSLRKTKYVMAGKGIKCGGYFDSENRMLVVATNRPDWLELFVHEYAHMTQWMENCPAWKYTENITDEIDRWLSGENVPNIEQIIVSTRALELDNEKRSVELIKRFNLPVDLSHYVQKANGYIYFYTWIMTTRRWAKPGNSPYSNEKVISTMPNEFQDSYEELPDYVRQIFVEENI